MNHPLARGRRFDTRQGLRTLLSALALVLVSTVTPSVSAATSAVVFEDLGQPCRAKQVLGGTVVRDRSNGHELFALANMNEVSGGELILIDLETGAGELFRAPAGAGSWNVREVPGDRLVIGTFYDGTFLIFDLKAKRFIQHVRFAKEEYLWNTALGRDGRVYAGTYPGGRLGALDLNTYTVEDCGAPAAPNMYLNTVSATPDQRLLCTFSTANPTQKLYDPRTKTWSDLPETLKGVAVGVVFDGWFLAGGRVFTGPDFKPVDPPFPIPGPGWQVETTLTQEDQLFLRLNNAMFRYRKGDEALTPLCDLDLRGGRYLAATADGDLVGIRGQDYFRVRRGSKALELKPVPTESGARNLLFLRIDSKGRIWSGPPFGQTLSYLDRKTRAAVNTRTICDAGGEVFDVAFNKGVVYAVAYSGGDIVAFDPAESWDQWNGKNPKTIGSLGARGYIRPVGGALMGPGGKLYSGWMAKYGVYGGAVAITDLHSGKTDLIENPLGEQTVSGLATDGKTLFIGSDRTANGLPNKPNDSARFGVLDPNHKSPSFQHTFTNATRVSAIGWDAKSSTVVFAVDGQLHRYTPGTQEPPSAIANAPKLGTRTLSVLGDGRVLYGSGKDVVTLDLATGQTQRRGPLPKAIENLAVDTDGTVIVSAGSSLYAVPPQAPAQTTP